MDACGEDECEEVGGVVEYHFSGMEGGVLVGFHLWWLGLWHGGAFGDRSQFACAELDTVRKKWKSKMERTQGK